MRRLNAIILTIMALGQLMLSPAANAAEPFAAPAKFNLAGSTMEMRISLETPRFGTLEMGLDPNPAPVTGFIDIDQLSTASGICLGAYRDITGTTQAEISRLGFNLNFTVTATLNADPLKGIFLWAKNRAAFYPDYMTLTLAFDGQSWDIPLTGIPMAADYNDGLLELDFEVSHADTFQGVPFSAVIALHLVGTLEEGDPAQNPGSGDGWVEVGLELNQRAFMPGDRLRLKASLANKKQACRVNFYVMYFDNDKNFFFAPEYTQRMAPFRILDLQAGEKIPPTLILDIPLPAHTPPIAASGACKFTAFVTTSDDRFMLSEQVEAPFTYNAPELNPAGPYDGDWYGTGTSDVPGGDCPPLADVVFRISNGHITGGAATANTNEPDDYEMTGYIDSNGEIVDGVLWEEFMNEMVAVGSFTGKFVGDQCTGTWVDQYGCHGSYTVEKARY